MDSWVAKTNVNVLIVYDSTLSILIILTLSGHIPSFIHSKLLRLDSSDIIPIYYAVTVPLYVK